MSSLLKRLIQSLQVLAQAILRLPLRLSRKLAHWFILRRETQGGFVLPTAVMVILVVTLITSAIVIRSTDRAQNASNTRVSQVVLNAALPAVERAKLKLDEAFEDPTLPQGTPSDLALNNVLERDQYQLGDEVRLQLAVDFRNNSGSIGGDDTIQANEQFGLDKNEVLTTAWRYPVDTDGNGKFDSFTLYGIYFRTPGRDDTGVAYERERLPLDARTPPQASASSQGDCAEALGTSASLVGAEGWNKIEGVLKKSFYIYTATVPITDIANNDGNNVLESINTGDYEEYQGNTAFAGLEYQQDRVRIPLGNNAIVYEDDLDMFSGTPLRLNGRVVVNSNLHAGESGNGGLFFYQVSSDQSCFYEAENAKILVGGNITNDFVGDVNQVFANRDVDTDLFQGRGQNPPSEAINGSTKSTDSSSSEVAYNTQAFEERISLLVDAAMDQNGFNVTGSYPNYQVTGDDPEDLRDRIRDRINAEVNPDTDFNRARREELEVWFRNRTRRVPFNEVGFGDSGTEGKDTGNVLQDAGTELLRPIDEWHYPDDVNQQLGIRFQQPPATDPEDLKTNDPPTVEDLLGDRILAGNNLPAFWLDPNLGEFVGELGEDELPVQWTNTSDGDNRYRKTRVRQLVDLGLTERDGFWETSAATIPENRLGSEGGLRIVTNAGVYLPFDNGTNLGNASSVVWPDSMPVVGLPTNAPLAPTAAQWADWLKEDTDGNGTPDTIIDRNGNNNPDVLDDTNDQKRPFLKMRAAAVYHYTFDNDDDPETPAPPIACVSSYYDPTNYKTAQNRQGLPDVSGRVAWNDGVGGVPPFTSNQAEGRSNNGVTYGPVARSQVGAFNNLLNYMADLVYPNGRMVNPLLRKALATPAADRTLADWGAIDSSLCALQIWDGTAGAPTTTPTGGYELPHGAIQEVAFLDGREIKAIEGNNINIPNTTLTWSNRGDTQQNNFPNQFGNNRNNYDQQPGATGRTGESSAPNDKISEYDLAVELRQPLEIRATVIDLDVLRRSDAPDQTTAGDEVRNTEWMLPDSGIIYATRDDALADASDKAARSSANIALNNLPNTPFNEANPNINLALHELERDRISPTDFWLDPTRRPDAIVLINGSRLGRNASNVFEDEEKGLILATNLPAYIKAQPPNGNIQGGFNVHDQEEFNNPLNPNWSNFYNRTQLNENFACRTNDPRLEGKCTQGDNWRAVSILSDSVTLLSENFRFGFRNEGDYDLRNNQTDNLFRDINTGNFPNTNIPVEDNISISKQRVDNGFWDNTFATNGLSSGNAQLGVFGTTNNYTDNSYSTPNTPPRLFSSYFNNFVTPVQRRVNGPEYVMEICRKLPVSECLPSDWVVGYDANGNNNLQATFNEPGVDINGNGTTNDTLVEADITSEQLLNLVLNLGTVNRTQVGAGTTALPPRDANDQQYPRRVAFKRKDGTLVLDNNNPPRPIPLGIDGNGNVDEFPYGTFPTGTNSNTAIQQSNNALWFRTTNNIGNPSQNINPNAPNGFANNNPLFYFPSSANNNRVGNPALDGYYDDQDDWVLPDVPQGTGGNTPLQNAANALNNVINFTVCLGGPGGGASPAITVNTIGGVCTNSALVNGAVNALPNVGIVFNLPTPLTTPVTLGNGGLGTVASVGNLNVYNYQVPASGNNNRGVGNPANGASQNFVDIGTPNTNTPVTITLQGDSNSLFIFHTNANDPLLFQNVNLVLDGVNPNQVFWVSRQGMVFAGENNLAGNFLSFGGANNQLIIDDIGQIQDSSTYANDDDGDSNPDNNYTPTNTVIRSGRFLGFSDTGGALPNAPGTIFNNFNTALNNGNIAITGITTTRQPLLAPALQIHRASGNNQTPFQQPANFQQSLRTYWLPKAPATENDVNRGTFNFIMATGDNPSRYRPNNPQVIEFNGAISNLARYLENWDNRNGDPSPVKIQGSFIQLQRSSYATAPYWQLNIENNVRANNRGSFLGYAQQYSTNLNYSQSYYPPTRQFGFDVGLLSQLPDLFSQRFTLPPTSEPNEYYREVGRNDDWIQALLCGVQLDQNGNPVQDRKAVNRNFRPNQCDTDL